MTCGIYMIKNKKTGQMYIGQSIDIERRWKEHCNGYSKKHSYIDSKYGENNFILKIITELPENKNLLLIHEKYWIRFYNTFKDDFHYNLTPGGDFNPANVPEIAKKMSETRIKKQLSKGKNNPMYGKKHSEESKKKMSQNHSDNSNSVDNQNSPLVFLPSHRNLFP